jgi:hypothetical protein
VGVVGPQLGWRGRDYYYKCGLVVYWCSGEEKKTAGFNKMKEKN